ncbi:hypothetical protein H4R35_007287, partial [Dimargaris xerosporica]
HIIRARLANEERPLKRCLQTFTHWAKAAIVTPTADQSLGAQLVLADLEQYQLAMAKVQQTQGLSAHEIAQYRQLCETTEANIAVTNQGIDALRKQLHEEQDLRQYKLSFDKVAQEILNHRPQEASLQEIAQLQQEIADLESEKKSRVTIVDDLNQQFDLALAEVQQLQGMIGQAKEANFSVVLDDMPPSQPSTPCSESNVEARPLASDADLSGEEEEGAIVEDN